MPESVRHPRRPVRSPGSHGVRRWSGLVATVGLLVVVGALGLLPRPAMAADARLLASEPRANAELAEAPGWVTLAFDSDVDLSDAKMLVTGQDGQNVTSGSLIVEGTNVTSQLIDPLAPGTYTVQYRLGRGDGETQGGSFQFAVGEGDFDPSATRTWSGSDDEPPVLRNPDPNATTTAPPPSEAPTTTVPRTSTRAPSSSPTVSGPPTTTAPSPSSSATPTGSTSASVTPAPESPGRSPWAVVGLIALGAALLAAAGVAIARLIRRRGAHD